MLLSYVKGRKAQYLLPGRIRIRTLEEAPPYFVFNRDSFRKLYSVPRSRTVELYEFFDTRKVEKEKVFEFLEFLLEEELVEEGFFRDTGVARRILLGRARSLLGIPGGVFSLADSLFHGGRAELYRREAKGRLLVFDLSSAYAHALTLPLPDWRTSRLFKGLTLEDLRDLEEEGWWGAVEGEFEVEDYLPPLPVRAKVRKGDRVLEETFFPVGKIKGRFCSSDVCLLEEGRVRIEKALLFRRSPSPLEEDVARLYRLKEESSGPVKVFYKLQLVSLFGLLSKRNPPPYRGGFFWNRLVGSFITAFTRKKIYLAMKKVLSAGGELVYCDTDGFIAKGVDRTLLEEGKGLGKWRLKQEGVLFRGGGVKQYELHTPDGKRLVNWKGIRLKDAVVHELDPLRGVVDFSYYDHWLGSWERVLLKADPVPKRKPDGSPFTVEELRTLLSREGGQKRPDD